MILRQVNELGYVPKRIISLVPSQTALLHYFELEDEVFGITKFCIHPTHWFQTKTRVGGTKNVHEAKVQALRPDLIIANKEENEQATVTSLAEQFPVWVTEVSNLTDACEMIKTLGELTGKTDKAQALLQQIRAEFSAFPQPKQPIKTAYLIWKDPYMTVGGDTYIHDIMQQGGFQNMFGQEKRYPIIDVETLKKEGCELLMLSSEPYPFQEKHVKELSGKLPGVKVITVDGERFSWYGSHLLGTAAYLNTLYLDMREAIT